MNKLNSYIGHVVTFGYDDTDETVTGVLFRIGLSFNVLDHRANVQRIDSVRQIRKDWGYFKAAYTTNKKNLKR